MYVISHGKRTYWGSFIRFEKWNKNCCQNNHQTTPAQNESEEQQYSKLQFSNRNPGVGFFCCSKIIHAKRVNNKGKEIPSSGKVEFSTFVNRRRRPARLEKSKEKENWNLQKKLSWKREQLLRFQIFGEDKENQLQREEIMIQKMNNVFETYRYRFQVAIELHVGP